MSRALPVKITHIGKFFLDEIFDIAELDHPQLVLVGKMSSRQIHSTISFSSSQKRIYEYWNINLLISEPAFNQRTALWPYIAGEDLAWSPVNTRPPVNYHTQFYSSKSSGIFCIRYHWKSCSWHDPRLPLVWILADNFLLHLFLYRPWHCYWKTLWCFDSPIVWVDNLLLN